MVIAGVILTSKEENILLQALDIILFELWRLLVQLFYNLDNDLKLEESCTSAGISSLEV